jgi:GNAT superfamily N-acetyltransferase
MISSQLSGRLTMIIRDAVVSDSAEIAELTLELGYCADAKSVASRLTEIVGTKDHLVLVAIVEGKIVGWLQVHVSVILESGFRSEIVGLIVSKTHRRCGIGRSLVGHAEVWAAQVGAEAVVVRSNTIREESHRFYPALGFSISKTQTVFRKHLNSRYSSAS